jgi:hypothetical protein
MLGKLKEEQWRQRNIFMGLLRTLMRFGMNRVEMAKHFPNWDEIDRFINEYGSREVIDSLLND